MDKKEEPHNAAQKKWVIFRYFNALKYNKDQSLNVCDCSTTNNSKYYENILAN